LTFLIELVLRITPASKEYTNSICPSHQCVSLCYKWAILFRLITYTRKYIMSILILMLSLLLIKILRGLYFRYSVYIIDSGLLWKQVMVHIKYILSPINILIPSRNILKCLLVTINTLYIHIGQGQS